MFFPRFVTFLAGAKMALSNCAFVCIEGGTDQTAADQNPELLAENKKVG